MSGQHITMTQELKGTDDACVKNLKAACRHVVQLQQIVIYNTASGEGDFELRSCMVCIFFKDVG